MLKIAQKEDTESYKNRRKRSFRKALLAKLVEDIKDGKSDNIENKSKEVNPSRPGYKSPLDRGTYNYGYMESDEFEAGTPNVW